MAPKTSVDWFAFRTKDNPDVICSTLSEVTPSHLQFSLAKRKTGWRSFEDSYDLWLTDTRGDPEKHSMRVGMAMSGGDAVKGWSMLSLSGDGCQWVDDWGRTMDVCTDQLDAFELKRVDIALDRYDGTHWEEVDAAWKAGLFAPPGVGRPPKAKPIDARRPEDGRTYYVGTRESAKFYRGYEKGLQLLGPQIASGYSKDPEAFDFEAAIYQSAIRIDHSQDEPRLVSYNLCDWWRDEVEFKPVTSPLPLDLVEQRDQYFAGAYPYLAQVLPAAEPHPLIQRRERMPRLELALMLEGIRHQYGNSLFTALHAYHGDVFAVWNKIVGNRHNKTMLAAGVLLVDHD